jgi:hypothetical protein
MQPQNFIHKNNSNIICLVYNFISLLSSNKPIISTISDKEAEPAVQMPKQIAILQSHPIEPAKPTHISLL